MSRLIQVSARLSWPDEHVPRRHHNLHCLLKLKAHKFARSCACTRDALPIHLFHLPPDKPGDEGSREKNGDAGNRRESKRSKETSRENSRENSRERQVERDMSKKGKKNQNQIPQNDRCFTGWQCLTAEAPELASLNPRTVFETSKSRLYSLPIGRGSSSHVTRHQHRST